MWKYHLEMPVRPMAFAASTILLLLSVVLVACGDECTLGDVRCEDNVAMTCSQASDSDAPKVWNRNDCGSGGGMPPRPGALKCAVATVAGRREAVCALSSERDPRCDSPPHGWCI